VAFDEVVKGFPISLAGKRVTNLAHTAWGILYHMWMTQRDILEFVRDPAYESPPWPAGYWPDESASAAVTEKQWEETAGKHREDLSAVVDLVKDPATDLLAPIPHGSGQTILREALLVIDHNSYHLGQLVDIRRLLGAWEK
jgi:hypothetical protein